jgi:aminoglycoside phosphotransferase (APT) family kinase protein
MTSSSPELVAVLQDQLRAVADNALAQEVAIEGLRQLTAGASRETWAFDAVAEDGQVWPLILRRDPPGTAPHAMSVEARAIEAAARAGVPEPRIVAYGDDGATLGAPFIIMERVAGETLPRSILRDPAYAGMRPALAEQCGEALARIHSISPDDVPGLPNADVLEKLRADFRSFNDASPALEAGFRWLDANRPPMRDDVVVHGDFRNGNLLVGPEGIRAVLDWELLHRGDPMQDLGYLCVRAWRFGAASPVGGFGDYTELFRGYERVSGSPVDANVVRWWEVFGTVWWGVGCLRQAWRHLSGGERSVELAAIGRRFWEQEYDLLVLLAGEARDG